MIDKVASGTVTRAVALKVVLTMDAAPSATEVDLRAVFADYTNQADQHLADTIAGAPAAARASLYSLTWEEKLDQRRDGRWTYYPKPELQVSNDSSVSLEQTSAQFAGYFPFAEATMRSMIDAAAPALEIKVLRWHMHPYDAEGRMSEDVRLEP